MCALLLLMCSMVMAVPVDFGEKASVVEPLEGYTQREATYVGIWVGTGFAGGIISAFLPSFTGTLGAAFYGFMFLGLWFCSLSSGGTVRTSVGRGLLFVGASITPGILSLFIDKMIFFITFSFGGSFIAVLGLDLYIRSGLFEGVAAFVTAGTPGDARSSEYVFDTKKQILLALSGGLGLIGLVAQWGWERWSQNRKHKQDKAKAAAATSTPAASEAHDASAH
ncbi:hypothetical protein HDU67_004533 [Dinochytrium kinnereticum]|nr:hypothetical protein HDU67_004533 [Dinochytrium kinnereticum]